MHGDQQLGNYEKLQKTSFLIYLKTLLQIFLKICLQVVNPLYFNISQNEYQESI